MPPRRLARFRFLLASIVTIIAARSVGADPAWAQVGSTLTGSSTDGRYGSGVALSSNGDFMAVGGHWKNSFIGEAFVYTLEDDTWVQHGPRFTGDSMYDVLGSAVALSADGSVVALSAPGSGDGGHVAVYEYRADLGNIWLQRGDSIQGGSGERIGSEISLSDSGDIVAFGTESSLSTRVYTFDATSGPWGAWTQRGSTIVGAEYSDSGRSISMSSDGSVVAIGESGANNDEGSARVFEWSPSEGDWVLRGSSLAGEQDNGKFGTAVALSPDGLTLAVSASSENGNKGNVYVYRFAGGDWGPLGLAIAGNTNDYLGTTLALSHSGAVVAVGTSNADQIRVFEYDSSLNWWFPRAAGVLNGLSDDDLFSVSMSMTPDGRTIAGGATLGGHNMAKGHVTVYSCDECVADVPIDPSPPPPLGCEPNPQDLPMRGDKCRAKLALTWHR